MPDRIITQTPRLLLREMTQADFPALCAILCDAEVMRAAYETPFTPQEAQGWLDRHLHRYAEMGFGLWAAVRKDTGEMIGQCGLTLQKWRGGEVTELGYLFKKAHWHRGYAAEAAVACRDYAFSALRAERVCSIIRNTNLPAQRVALRCGMRPVDRDGKNFRHTDMDFILFSVNRPRQ